MRRILNALLGLSEAGVDAYMNMRARFFAAIAMLSLLVVFQIYLNYHNWTELNVAIAFALMWLANYAATHPAVIAATAALEAAREKEKTEKPKNEAPTTINTGYFAFYQSVILLWISIYSMFVTTLPLNWYLSFREALGAVLLILLFLTVVGWMTYHRWSKITILKKVVKAYTYAGILILAWTIVPGSLKFYLTGIEFYGSAGTSERAKAVAKANRTVQKALDESDAERILRIGKSISKGKQVSKEDAVFWDRAQAEVASGTLPAKAKSWASTISLPSFEGLREKKESPAPQKVVEKIVYVPVATPAVAKMETTVEAPEPSPQDFHALWKLEMDKEKNGRWWWSNVQVSELGEKIKFEKFENNYAVFEGKRISEDYYEGEWHEDATKSSGNLKGRLSPDKKIFTGEIEIDGGKWVPLRIQKI